MDRGREEISWSMMSLVLVLSRPSNPSSELRIAEHIYERSALGDLLGVPVDKVKDDARVPTSLDEWLRINLWLRQGLPPTNGQEVEAVISRFGFAPAALGRSVVAATNCAAPDPIIEQAKDGFFYTL